MSNIKLGYACINIDVGGFKSYKLADLTPYNKNKIKGVICHNLKTTIRNIKWNIENDVQLYRLTSELIPLESHSDFREWQKEVNWNWEQDDDIFDLLDEIKRLKEENKMILSFHPGQYTVLDSKSESVVKASIADLYLHYALLDYIEGDLLILHVGGVYGNKKESINRFIQVVNNLPENVKSKLAIENDDKSYNILEVMHICRETNTLPLFDYHHNKCNPAESVNIKEIINEIIDIWDRKRGYVKFHLSSGKTYDKDRSHSDTINKRDYTDLLNLVDYYKKDIYIMLECKEKNSALLKLRRENTI